MHAPMPEPISVDMLLLAYRSGIFPMADRRDDPDLYWVEPRERAIIPLDRLHVSKSLRKTLRQDRFTVTVNQAFDEVIAACAAPRPGHPESWISMRIQASYRKLHEAGYAHSIECWQDRILAGGLYGVSFDRVFCGESMFSLRPDASKVALCWLVAMMQRAGFELLDCQFMTDHLARLGALELPQADYLERLIKARGKAQRSLLQAHTDIVAEAARYHSSPGKLIAQSLTQTS